MKKTRPLAVTYLRRLFLWGLILLPMSYLSDCVLDAVLFGEGNVVEQLFNPGAHELAIRMLFATFIIAGIFLGGHYLARMARTERLLRQRNEDLLLANQELEEFSFTLSHDLRNMLGKMYASASLLKEQCQTIQDEKARFLIDKIAAASDQMESQVEALLNLAMIASGDLNRADVELSRLAREITGAVLSEQENNRYTLNIQERMYAECDAKLMGLALKSLFSNALKFIPKDRQGVIDFGQITRQGETIFFLRDNGIGFDEERARHLFDPYSQPENVDELSGSGIGLATVQRVIHRHGGRVWAEGVPDAGATFFFTLRPKN